jgi:hypothetical protein
MPFYSRFAGAILKCYSDPKALVLLLVFVVALAAPLVCNFSPTFF